jgi:hypothetical protein
MKRFHAGGAAIKAANLAHDGARQDRRGIDSLELIVQPAGTAVNVHKEWLDSGCCAGNRSFQP